jgi:chromosome segregation ATPase
MASFFKKAMGLFVEFDENAPAQGENKTSQVNSQRSNTNQEPASLSQETLDKFQKHFDQLFDQANFPGPDYFEFFKMMETLEHPIPDEKARISAVYASLAIQGLTKSKLVDTATQYKTILEQDKMKFSAAINEKSRTEVEGRKQNVAALQNKITANSDTIQKLTKEITDAQATISTLQSEIAQEKDKMTANANGYQVSYDAIQAKISSDIQKIQTIL